jgi:hypothetical protein
MAFQLNALEKGMMCVGSADGELVHAGFVRPEGEENPDYVKNSVQVRL